MRGAPAIIASEIGHSGEQECEAGGGVDESVTPSDWSWMPWCQFLTLKPLFSYLDLPNFTIFQNVNNGKSTADSDSNGIRLSSRSLLESGATAIMDEAVSLSIDIEEDVQDNFETFAKLYKYGHFAEARSWFDNCFGASSWKESFPLAAELAKCLLDQGDFQALARLATEAKHLFYGPESRLMELIQVLADVESFRTRSNQGLDKERMVQFQEALKEAVRVLFEHTTPTDAYPIGLHGDVKGGASFELGVSNPSP